MGNDKCAIGVDLGGTKIEIALVNEEGMVLKRVRLATEASKGAQQIEEQILETIRSLEKEAPTPIVGVGVGVAGQIEAKTGVVHFAPNLGWRDVPLQSSLSQLLKKNVTVINDVRAATWGEWIFGAGKGAQDFVCLFIGTGIGCGVVSGGNLLNGSTNTFGEVGHLPIDLRGPECTCGNKGCFESLAGGWGIAKRAQEAVRKYGVAGIYLVKAAGGDINKITAKQLFEGAKNRDPLSELLVEQIKQALIAGCVAIVNAYNPSRLILGGGVIEGAPELIKVIEAGVYKHALKAATTSLSIVPAQLRHDAGVIGGAALAMQLARK